MLLRKIVTKVGFGKSTCKQFETEINQLLNDGWEFAADIRYRRVGLFRFLLMASLMKSDQVELES